MFIFSPYAYTLAMAGSLFITMGCFLKLLLFLLLNNCSFTLTLSTFLFSQTSLDASLFLTPMSCLFSAAVAFISTTVFFFTTLYFHQWTKISYFCWFTLAFVLCMLVLINFNDFFFVMLGWDGLGVSSYFLILYFQSPSSVYSGTFTILMNRLGDCFLVIFIIFWWYSSVNTHFMMESNTSDTFMALLLFIALSTKSALFPFSPWLPAAMAAPTPISSLVHSSTLVTAGLFLMIQNTSILVNSSLCYFMLVTSMFTSLYAGITALLESDLKKIVALSTLSHLGFMGMAISLNLPYLAFFHLLTHAFFKSSLFMSVGVFIISHGHYQDSRSVTSTYCYNPYFSSVVLVSEANLFGLPFLSGFYSKDLILELSQYSSMGSALSCILYVNVLLTFSYTLRILLSLSEKNNIPSFSLSSNSLSYSTAPFMLFLFLLSLVSLVFGLFFSKMMIQSEISIPPFLKMAPTILLLCLSFLFFLSSSLFVVSKSTALGYFISSMFFLSPVWTNFSSRLFIFLSQKVLFMEESFMKSVLMHLVQLMFKILSNLLSYAYVSVILSSSKVYWVIFVLLLVCIPTLI